MSRLCFHKTSKAVPTQFSLTLSGVACLLATSLSAQVLSAQVLSAQAPLQSSPQALQVIRAAVAAELEADRNDHTAWAYRDHDTDDTKDVLYEVVETPVGSLKREVASHGKPVDSTTQTSETERIATFVHSPDAQAKQRKAGQHDDDQAREMTKMLPDAYIWTIESEDAETTTLKYRPNPQFHPPNIEAHVMGTMAGEVIVVKGDNRIRTLRGALTDDVKIGYGLLGKLQKGGTFDIERREVAPHHWQITESRVHIGGHALLFKTIGQQEDEIKTDFRLSTAPNLEAAAAQLGVGGR